MVKSSLSDFNQTAQKLSRNPLGIIALFIVLVYGIAALLLGISSDNLQATERLPLIYFLVFFPFIVLIAFYRLVAKHHVKLYAPEDFQDKEGFFRALSPLEQKQKLEEEIRNIEEEIKTDILPSNETKNRKLTVEMESSGILKTSLIRHAYVLAEELAFREIEREFETSVHRQVAVGRDHGYDGIFMHKGKPIVIEIKYTRHPQHSMMMMRRELDRFAHIDQAMKPEPSFLYVVVAEGLNVEQTNREKGRLIKMVEEAKLPVEIRIYNFDELKDKYGFSEINTQQ